MHQILFEIGDIKIASYGVFLALAFVSGMIISMIRRKKFGISSDEIWDLAFHITLWAIVGSKLLHMITVLPMIIRQGFAFSMLRAGFVFYGGLIGGIAGGFYSVRKNKKDYRVYMDLLAPVIPMCHAIGRIGCFLNGCCYGNVTECSIGIVFPAIGDGQPRIPTQLIECIFLVIFSVGIMLFEKKKRFSSQMFYVYVTAYSVFRFIIEFFRGDNERGFAGGLSTSQWVSLLLFAVSVSVYFRNYSRWKRSE